MSIWTTVRIASPSSSSASGSKSPRSLSSSSLSTASSSSSCSSGSPCRRQWAVIFSISSSSMKAPWMRLQLRAVAGLEEHVALAEQRLGAVLVEDHARVGLRGDGEGDPRRDVRLDHAGDDVRARALGGEQQVDADGARLLRQPDDRVLDLARRDHHQVGQLVDHAEDVGQRPLALADAHPVELLELARARLAHQRVALLHLADQVLQHVRRQPRARDDRRQQVRDRARRGSARPAWGRPAPAARRSGDARIRIEAQHRVDAARLAGAGGARDQHVRLLGEVDADRAGRRCPCRARPSAATSPRAASA